MYNREMLASHSYAIDIIQQMLLQSQSLRLIFNPKFPTIRHTERDCMDDTQKYEALLMQIVAMFQFASLQHMGKLKNPVTEKIERDLPQAQIAIDMLVMLPSRKHSTGHSQFNLAAQPRKPITSKLSRCMALEFFSTYNPRGSS